MMAPARPIAVGSAKNTCSITPRFDPAGTPSPFLSMAAAAWDTRIEKAWDTRRTAQPIIIARSARLIGRAEGTR